jgi:UDP:flavonoid glycosyltransferase YjiC (YdhE family)
MNNMKKILVMPDGNWLSHVSRPFEIAKVLRKMGHNVMFASDGYYMKLPREAGFKVFPIKTISPDHVLFVSRSGRLNWYSYSFLKECVEEDLKLFSNLKPDLVLGDFRLSLSTSCELANIPLAVTLNASWTNYYDYKIKWRDILRIRSLLWIFILTFDSTPYRKLRKDLGLDPRANIWEIWRGDLNLIVDIPEYGPTKNLPPNFHYIGPVIWEPEIDVPDWFERIDPEKPTIYFTMGSTGYEQFFEQAVEIFKDSKYQCIMTTAGMANLSCIPENFFVTDYAPGSKIMEKSDVVVCQGGNGTIYQAMSRGLPIIGLPTMLDQVTNLNRVVDLGIGVYLNTHKFKQYQLVKAVEKVLSDKRYKENSHKYRKILERYNAPKKGAELIDFYLNQR